MLGLGQEIYVNEAFLKKLANEEMTDIIIRVTRDGNQTCAIIGDIPEEIAVGFGNTVDDALYKLMQAMNFADGICPICWNEVEPLEQCYECDCGNKWESFE